MSRDIFFSLALPKLGHNFPRPELATGNFNLDDSRQQYRKIMMYYHIYTSQQPYNKKYQFLAYNIN